MNLSAIGSDLEVKNYTADLVLRFSLDFPAIDTEDAVRRLAWLEGRLREAVRAKYPGVMVELLEDGSGVRLCE